MSNAAGNDLVLTCMSLIKEFVSLKTGPEDHDNPCRVAIVKSKSLHNRARRLYHAQRIVSGAQSIVEERGTSIIASVGVDQYRETITFAVNNGEVCCEIGCHFGTSTMLIDEAAWCGDKNDLWVRRFRYWILHYTKRPKEVLKMKMDSILDRLQG
jgi:ribosomal protein L27